MPRPSINHNQDLEDAGMATSHLRDTTVRAAAALIFIIVLACISAYGQGKTQYLYDANGRLVSVTLPDGEEVIYSYDPAGNITSIKHVNGSGPILISYSPNRSEERRVG